jgi:hypothetical protein
MTTRPRSPHTFAIALTLTTATALLLAATPHPAHAGGGPQNVLVVVDPTDPDALRVANHYIAARGIPPANVLYLSPSAADYAAFAQFQIPAVLGTLKQRGLEESIDYVVTAGQAFYVPAQRLVNGLGCTPVSRFSTSGAWTLAYAADEILDKTLVVTETNRYYADNDMPRAFDSRTLWQDGAPAGGPVGDPEARRYLLGFQLGYSGERGNTVDETIAMIDRSVRADGARPEGTFYFMRNGDIRSQTRAPYFQTAIDGLQRLGGKGEIVDGTLPLGRHDTLGIMAGSPNLDIAGADLTLLLGAWADHLTSHAATFDEGGQTKLSPWIPKGASGSVGTVEEPCVFGSHEDTTYHEKFPHPRLATFYFAGMSLGEALFRSTPFAPFHALFYGDPLTRPFAVIPTVTVPDAPTGSVSGVLVLHPAATTTKPATAIARFDLFVDGQRLAGAKPGDPLWIDTHRLPDGPRDLRVVAYDDSAAAVQGMWRATLDVRNQPGRSVALTASTSSGDLMTLFHLEIQATGGDELAELRLRHHGRILASAQAADIQSGSAAIDVDARLLGAGRNTLVAEAMFRDDRIVTSAPTTLQIAPTLPDPIPDFAPRPPEAYSYTLEVPPGEPLLLDLPALAGMTGRPDVTVIQPPRLATVDAQGGAFLLRPRADAVGTEELGFRADGFGGRTATGTVTLRYCKAPVITQQPKTTFVCAGKPAVLEVAAEAGMAFQWFKDSEPLIGEVAARLVIPIVGSPTGEGSYHVVVSNRCGAMWLETRSNGAEVRHGDCGTATPDPARGTAYLPWAGTGRGD